MSRPLNLLARSCAIATVLALGCLATDAQAQSRRDREAAEALQQRMLAAEARYREALLQVANDDPAGLDASNAALEDMEDIMVACEQQRGCSLSQLLTSYKRLLKADADAQVPGDDGDLTIVDDTGMPTGPVPERASAASLLREDENFVRMVQLNPAVQEGIRRWLTDMRVSLITSHENYQYMQHLMSPAFKRSGLPEALLFGILAKESNGRVHARSRAGAAGPLQFMPATGRRFGLGPDGSGFDTRYDPRAAADAAAVYLNERFAQHGQEIEYWLAAYNGGEGRALRIYREANGRSFWDPTVFNQFPAETKDYVPMVIAAAWLYLHPEQYGLTFPKVDARPATFTLERPASIYELTICLGNGGTRDGYMRVLRNLNPSYEADAWIPRGTTLNGTVRVAGLYRRWCTSGPRAQLAQELVNGVPRTGVVRTGAVEVLPAAAADAPRAQAPAAAPAPATPPPARTHRVARGETLGRIAERYGCEVTTLARANNLRAPAYTVRQGQTLTLAGCTR
ncbi:transglycosylase SLT domain-containing protein [Luteimonas sp. BDR2-5]|uniref:transglycosylase SLT domain-containing protein n=1 Tax=Proluteimonas luteida TaxID=2878685 RepID=UPI001E53E539|nr:transglycosylase SLT domain-containing protein [Luteimonas sp. BDR2-5]MCD9029947.1 transglycosylase SLT domain-containing protein [Luteimonas sp. BDR2-5]